MVDRGFVAAVGAAADFCCPLSSERGIRAPRDPLDEIRFVRLLGFVAPVPGPSGFFTAVLRGEVRCTDERRGGRGAEGGDNESAGVDGTEGTYSSSPSLGVVLPSSPSSSSKPSSTSSSSSLIMPGREDISPCLGKTLFRRGPVICCSARFELAVRDSGTAVVTPLGVPGGRGDNPDTDSRGKRRVSSTDTPSGLRIFLLVQLRCTE
jgi:hypothetical protein